jgi:hypothetical protein
MRARLGPSSNLAAEFSAQTAMVLGSNSAAAKAQRKLICVNIDFSS